MISSKLQQKKKRYEFYTFQRKNPDLLSRERIRYPGSGSGSALRWSGSETLLASIIKLLICCQDWDEIESTQTEDKASEKFNERVKRDPHQILRYLRRTREGNLGKMKNPKVQKSERCENVKSNNRIIQKSKVQICKRCEYKESIRGIWE